MKSGDRLLKLIESLTPNEKGYFKKQASLNRKESKQLKLFDFLCKQSAYNEQQIAKKFKNEDFIKNLRIINKSLEMAILKCMRSYHSDKSAHRILSGMLADVEFTFKKELYTVCEEIVEKACQLADSKNLLEFSLLFRHWKFRIKKRILSDYEFSVPWLIEEEKEYLKRIDKIRNEITLFFWESKVLSLSKGLNNPEINNQLNESIDETELLKFEQIEMPTLTKFRYYNTCGIYYYYCKLDFKKAFNQYLKARDTLKNDPVKTNQHVENHSSILITLMSNAMYTNRFKEYKELRKEMDDLPMLYTSLKKRPLSKFKKDYLVPLNDIMFCNRIGDHHGGLTLIKKLIEKERKFIRDNEYFHSLTLYLYAHSYFLAGDYNEAFDWLNRLLYANERRIKDKIFYHSKVLEIILHCDLNNDRFIPNLLRNFSRYLNKQSRKQEFEKILLKCFRKKTKYTRNKEWVADLKKYYPELKKYKVELTRDLPYFDVISWVESKIEDRSYSDILKGKST